MIRAVLDTNILVSARLNSHGAPAQVLLLTAVEPDLQRYVSGEIFAEYEEVLRRPLFRRSESEIENTLRNIRQQSFWVRPSERGTRLLRSG